MKEPLLDRLKHSWNAFSGKKEYVNQNLGPSYGYRPDHHRFSFGNKQNIVSSIYNRISVDCAQVEIVHSRVDENGNYSETIDDELNKLFTVEANLDQSGRAFMQDVIESMLDEGIVAVVPTMANTDPTIEDSFKIKSMRTAEIVSWYPKHVKVRVLNDLTGQKEELIFPKKVVAICENPFYAIMNEPNSILQRLIHKINLLDKMDEDAYSGKLNLIVQLPYVIKSQARKIEAEKRRKEIENQLTEGKYGIAYIDGTEKITQLNRPLENDLYTQVQDLQKMLYSIFGITEDVFNGTASEEERINYYNRTIEPLVSTVVLEYKRKFITKTARSQGQSISFFRDPFNMATIESIAKSADQLCRNGILTPNEIRPKIGYKASEDPNADQLYNRNMPNDAQPMPGGEEMLTEENPEIDTSDPMSINVNDL